MLDEQKAGKAGGEVESFSGLLIMVKLENSAGEGNIIKIILKSLWNYYKNYW